ncbi:MAG: hypothetical protein CVU71_12545 [Deltaproteobacteria bacterium HGW-Deltaproteobacteria-6]|jgi:hypothetical protein|nr:MAG: hypothetical protein CVU71_12545 [Deltaproteobacteria bacterium HGW-Deltaproteobacteria-6]
MILQKLADNIFRSTGCLYSVFLLFIIVLKWPFFSMPPVWDEAFSIFPAADFLVRHGFDYSLLMAQPGYHDGGPTAHALSLLTLVTALVLKITGGGKMAWLILHVLQWLMAAAIGTLLARIYSRLFDDMTAFLLAAASLAYPLMLAQIGRMYIEIPLLFFSLFAFYNYRNDRIWLTSLCLLAACLTKGSGIIAVGVVCILALFSKNKSLKNNILDFFVILIPSFAVLFALSSIGRLQLAFSNQSTFTDLLNEIIYRNLHTQQIYISSMPELNFIIAGSVVISIFVLLKNIIRYVKSQENDSNIIIYNCLFIIAFSIFHFVVYAYIQISDSASFISRYFFYVIPSMFLVIYYSIDEILKVAKIRIFVLLLIIIIFLINRNGMFYPEIPHSSIAIAERSEEYVDGYRVQKEYIRVIENEVPENIPVYVDLPDYFLTHYPVSQYVGKPLANVYLLRHVVKLNGSKFIYPDHFVLVYNYPWLGGRHIKYLLQDVSGNKEFLSKELGYFKRGCFSARVVEVKRKQTASF